MPPQTHTVTLSSTELLNYEIRSHRPSIDLNSNIVENPKKNKKLSRILTNHTTPFTYIADGDFSLVWINITLFIVAHIFALDVYYRIITDFSSMRTLLLAGTFFGYISGLGITAGAHRLWSHRSYKAKLPLRIFLMICQTMAGQNCLYIWCRDHRVHHKFSETDGDPHNTHRGFFFAHVGWLLRKKHPDVLIKSDKLDFSDLLADPVVKFQMDYYIPLYFIFAVVIPGAIPYYLSEASVYDAFSCYVCRYMIVLHSTWFVNSTAHLFGEQPYSKKQQARENSWVSYGALGEGYHNYHHTFPFDYRTSEDGMKLNFSKLFIDYMAKIGQAYDLKSVNKETIKTSKEKTLLSLEH